MNPLNDRIFGHLKASLIGMSLIIFASVLLYLGKIDTSAFVMIFLMGAGALGMKNSFFGMKDPLVIFILFSIGLSSCATQKMCNRKFPPHVTTSDSTVIKDSTVIRYVDIPVPPDTIRETVQVMIDCDKQGHGTIRPINKSASSSRANINLKIEGNKIIATASCDSLNLKIQEQDHIIKEFRLKQKEEVQAPPKDNHLPWYVWFCAGIAFTIIIRLILKIFFHI